MSSNNIEHKFPFALVMRSKYQPPRTSPGTEPQQQKTENPRYSLQTATSRNIQAQLAHINQEAEDTFQAMQWARAEKPSEQDLPSLVSMRDYHQRRCGDGPFGAPSPSDLDVVAEFVPRPLNLGKGTVQKEMTRERSIPKDHVRNDSKLEPNWRSSNESAGSREKPLPAIPPLTPGLPAKGAHFGERNMVEDENENESDIGERNDELQVAVCELNQAKKKIQGAELPPWDYIKAQGGVAETSFVDSESERGPQDADQFLVGEHKQASSDNYFDEEAHHEKPLQRFGSAHLRGEGEDHYKMIEDYRYESGEEVEERAPRPFPDFAQPTESHRPLFQPTYKHADEMLAGNKHLEERRAALKAKQQENVTQLGYLLTNREPEVCAYVPLQAAIHPLGRDWFQEPRYRNSDWSVSPNHSTTNLHRRQASVPSDMKNWLACVQQSADASRQTQSTPNPSPLPPARAAGSDAMSQVHCGVKQDVRSREEIWVLRHEGGNEFIAGPEYELSIHEDASDSITPKHSFCPPPRIDSLPQRKLPQLSRAELEDIGYIKASLPLPHFPNPEGEGFENGSFVTKLGSEDGKSVLSFSSILSPRPGDDRMRELSGLPVPPQLTRQKVEVRHGVSSKDLRMMMGKVKERKLLPGEEGYSKVVKAFSKGKEKVREKRERRRSSKFSKEEKEKMLDAMYGELGIDPVERRRTEGEEEVKKRERLIRKVGGKFKTLRRSVGEGDDWDHKRQGIEGG